MSGFTYIELIIVILILAIVAVAAVPAVNSYMVDTKLDRAAMQICADLRYAQNMAITDQSIKEVAFDVTNESYEILATRDPLRQTAQYVRVLRDSHLQGVDITSAVFGGEARVKYDVLGVPKSGGTVQLRCGDGQRTITVNPATGVPKAAEP